MDILFTRMLDALSIFTIFHRLAEKQFYFKMKEIQSDGGGEFKMFSKYVSEHGIIHRLTCIHQNKMG